MDAHQTNNNEMNMSSNNLLNNQFYRNQLIKNSCLDYQEKQKYNFDGIYGKNNKELDKYKK